MERRSFLINLGFLPFLNFSSFFGGEKDSEKQLALKILNDKKNWKNYSNFKIEHGRKYLERKGIKYIVDSSKNILKDNPTTSSGKIHLGLTKKFLKKVFYPNPPFVFPFIGKILFNFNLAEKPTTLLAKINKKDKTIGLWYGNSSNPEEEGSGQISIPYYDEEKILIYAEGEKFGVKGNLVSLIQYREPSKNNLYIRTSCFLDVKPNLFSFLSFGLINKIAANNSVEEIKNILRNYEIFSKILDVKKIEYFKKKYPKKEVNWLEKIILLKEETFKSS